MKITIQLISILILSGCHTQRNLTEMNLKEEVQKNWAYNNEQKFYKASYAFTDRLDSAYQDFLIGKDTSYISKMFGSHYSYEQTYEGWLVKQFPNGMRYNLSLPSGNELGQSNCPYFFFYIDKRGRVGKVFRVDLMSITYE